MAVLMVAVWIVFLSCADTALEHRSTVKVSKKIFKIDFIVVFFKVVGKYTD
jgi:hypothetical protein